MNHPNCRMMYDTFHANIEEKSIAEAIRTAAPYTVHVHISENDRSTPGAGPRRVEGNLRHAAQKSATTAGWSSKPSASRLPEISCRHQNLATHVPRAKSNSPPMRSSS